MLFQEENEYVKEFNYEEEDNDDEIFYQEGARHYSNDSQFFSENVAETTQ